MARAKASAPAGVVKTASNTARKAAVKPAGKRVAKSTAKLSRKAPPRALVAAVVSALPSSRARHPATADPGLLSVFESSSSAMLVVEGGQLSALNAAARTLFCDSALTPLDLTGSDARALFARAAQFTAFRKALQRLDVDFVELPRLAGGIGRIGAVGELGDVGAVPLKVQLSLRLSGGAAAACWLQAQRLRDLKGHASPRLLWTVSPLTQELDAPARLKEAELQFHALLDNDAIGIAFVREQEIRRCNARMEAMFGYPVGALVGQATRNLYASEADFQQANGVVYGLFAQGDTVQISGLRRRRDGTAFHARQTGRMLDRDDPAKGAVWMVEDITATEEARVALEQARAALEARVAARTLELNNTVERLEGEIVERESVERALRLSEFALDNAAIANVWLSREGVVVQANRMACEYTGLTHAELLGLSIAQIDCRATQAGWQPHWEALVATKIRIFESEWEVLGGHAKGRRFPVAVTSSYLDYDGEPYEVGFVSDISERQRAENALRVQRERLLHYRTQLLELARQDRSDFRGALEHTLSVAALTLQCNRASFWTLDASGDGLTCEMEFHAGMQQLMSQAEGEVASAHNYPEYFAALRRNQPVIARDAQHNPLTARIAQALDQQRSLGVVRPADAQKIVAMIDYPVWLQGRLAGMICLEHTASASGITASAIEMSAKGRDWHADEIDFAANIATMVALTLEEAERRGFQARLQHLAHHDALTGLPNRQLLQDRLSQAILQARRDGRQLGVLFVDLDRFKLINDTLGHDVGDEVLRETANRMRAAVRAGDTVARLGGDEFVVMLPISAIPVATARSAKGLDGASVVVEESAVRAAEGVATKLLRALQEPFKVAGQDLQISGSIGIALFPDDGTDVASLMKHADVAMYHAKESGRDGVQFFRTALNQRASQRLGEESGLRRALENGELTLLFESQIDLATGRVLAVEAQPHWQHPQEGLLAAPRFAKAADTSALVGDFTAWVLRAACLQARDWARLAVLGESVPVSVKLSRSQWLDRALPRALRAALDHSGLAPRWLELEISESALAEAGDAGAAVWGELANIGVGLVLSEFGAGATGLAALQRLRPRKLKLDTTFVHAAAGPTASTDAQVVARATIAMALQLNLPVVAEGVERVAQHAFFAQAGCQGAQGPLFGVPLAGSERARIFSDYVAPTPMLAVVGVNQAA